MHFIVFFTSIIFFINCGDPEIVERKTPEELAKQKQEAEKNEIANKLARAAYALNSSKDLPECNKDISGALVYIKEDKNFFLCDEEKWQPINLKGEKGDLGNEGKIGPTGPTGETGPEGAKGDIGPKGNDGKNGLDGTKGLDGKDGINGKDGKDGSQGQDGSNGRDGRDGLDGLNSGILNLEAMREYSPDKNKIGFIKITQPTKVTIPYIVPVIYGNAGNHKLTLKFNMIICEYKGGAEISSPLSKKISLQIEKGRSYVFEKCSNRQTSGEVINLFTDSKIELEIQNGDSVMPTIARAYIAGER